MSNLNAEKEKIKKIANEVYQDEKAKMSETYQQAKDKAENVSDSASLLFERGIEKIKEFEGSIKDCSNELIHSIKEKPLPSFLIAAGIGYLMARLFNK